MEARKRSKNYPGATLTDSIANLRLVSTQLGSGAHKREDISSAIGSPKLNGGSVRKIAAMSAFGLLAKSGEGYAISELGRKILKPLEGELPNLLKEAFLKVDLYREVCESYDKDGRLPEGMPIILERKYGIADGIGDYAFKILKESGVTAGVLTPDSQFVEGPIVVDAAVPITDYTEEAPEHVPTSAPSHRQSAIVDRLKIELPRPSVVFECPRTLSTEEKKRVEDWINKVLIPQFEFLVEENDEPDQA